MKLELIERYYDIASDFNDSISLVAVLLIIHGKTDLNFVDIKKQLSELEFDKSTIDAIEDIACSTPSHEMGRLIRLLSPIDQLLVRDRPREIPSVITLGRQKLKREPKTKKQEPNGLFEKQ